MTPEQHLNLEHQLGCHIGTLKIHELDILIPMLCRNYSSGIKDSINSISLPLYRT